MTNAGRRRHPQDRGRAWPAVLAAAVALSCLGTLPLILQALGIHLEPVAATSSHGVTLLQPPKPATISLPAAARPAEADGAPAAQPAAGATRAAAVVRTEDNRLRTMLHAAIHVKKVEMIQARGSLPTLVLTARPRPYTAADLVRYGAMIMAENHAGVLRDNIFVSVDAQLSLGGTGLRSLYLETGSGQFASIVGWDATLSFYGTSGQPLTITSWDMAKRAPAADQGGGRSYIRDMGGSMTLSYVRVSSLGFWSGRTGGVAWTGLSDSPSTGGASNSRFTGSTYGAFLSRTSGITFRNDLFESNELDGVRVHRNSTATMIVSSAAVRNGGNGFVVSRATQESVLKGDVAEHNGGNGFYIDGRPLVNGASASGGSTTPGSGAVIEDSAALGNGKTGILIEGGIRPVVKADQVCAAVTAIAVRYGVTSPVLTGNYVGCAARTGVEIGPSAPGTVVSGNAVTGARMGIVVSDSGQVQLDNNHISKAGVFGITVRGQSSKVAGVGDVVAGNGFRAVDARAGASQPALAETDLSGWAHHVRITFFSYLHFHPLAALWLGMAILVLAAALRAHLRKLPLHPYPASAARRRAAASIAVADPKPARHRSPAPADPLTRPLPASATAAQPGYAASQYCYGASQPGRTGGQPGYGSSLPGYGTAQPGRRPAPAESRPATPPGRPVQPARRPAPPPARTVRPAADRSRAMAGAQAMPEPVPGLGGAAGPGPGGAAAQDPEQAPGRAGWRSGVIPPLPKETTP